MANQTDSKIICEPNQIIFFRNWMNVLSHAVLLPLSRDVWISLFGICIQIDV